MLAALDRELPGGARSRVPRAATSSGPSSAASTRRELLARAEAAGVTFVKGTDFGGAPDTLRLAYSFVSPDEIADGVARLAAALPAAV